MAIEPFDAVVSATSAIKIRISLQWLSTLPQSPLMNGYVIALGDNVIRSQIKNAIANLRSRSGSRPGSVKFPIIVTHAQKLLLDTFYFDRLKGGIKTFSLQLPGETNKAYLKFADPPSYRPITHNLWNVDISFEKVLTDDNIEVDLLLE